MKIINRDTLLNIYRKNMVFVRFCMVGVTNTLLSLIVYYLLLKAGVYYLYASITGYVCGILNGYILSSLFVFRKGCNVLRLGKFVAVYGSALLLNTGIMYILVDIIKIHELLAQAITILLILLYNYSLNSLWTFK